MGPVGEPDLLRINADDVLPLTVSQALPAGHIQVRKVIDIEPHHVGGQSVGQDDILRGGRKTMEYGTPLDGPPALHAV